MSMKKGAVVLWIALLLKSLSCSAAEEKDRLRDRWDTYPDVYAGFHSHSLGQKHDTPFPSYSSPGPHIHHFYDDPSGPLAPTGPSGLLPYGAPLPPIYGAPYSAPDHSFRGLDFAILCKIVLKVLIFKMIVKFIAVICVLLFLPKLDSGGSSGGDRKVLPKEATGSTSDEHLNRLTRLVMESVEKNAALEKKEMQRRIRILVE